MGLDWHPLSRPRSGHEQEFVRLFYEVAETDEDDKRAELLARFREISEAPYAVLGAPRIGIDASADEWLSQRLSKNERLEKGRATDKKSMHDYYVLDVLPKRDRSPVYYEQHEGLQTLFEKISEPAVIGASRIVVGASTDGWLQHGLSRQAEKFREARKSMHGHYVLDLLPECDGFPVYSNYGMYEGLERYSFRAKFLDDADDILGTELMERRYSAMLVEELRRYGTQLYEKTRAYAQSEAVQHVERLRHYEDRLMFDRQHPARRAHILFSAAKWCLYWAERGHGLDPDF